jgi:NitT/TauT family transport system permease protein
LRKSKLVTRILAPFSAAWRWSYRAIPIAGDPKTIDRAIGGANWMVWIWYLLIIAAVLVAVRQIVQFVTEGVPVSEIATVGLFGLATMARVFVLIAIASAIWVPVGVWIGLRPNVARVVQPIAQFLAAFPANLLFPIAVSAIVVFRLDPNIWLSPLMILGTQWYILFNVIAGASAVPSELRHIGANLQVRGWLWWRRIGLPAVFPFYVTGAITASGGSWNASIVAEVASWGEDKLQAYGLGAYIAQATAAGDFHRIVLGIAVMSAFVTIINRAFWRPLYYYAESKFRLG